MPPANSSPTAHDFNPDATPGRKPLPQSLRPLPWVCLILLLGSLGDCAHSAWLLRTRQSESAALRSSLETAVANQASQQAELGALRKAAIRANSLAQWVTAGCHAQAFLVHTLQALPPGLPAHRIALELQEISRQLEVTLDLGGGPDLTAGALARIEGVWTDQRIRISARENGAGDERRRVFRMSLNLPEPGAVR